MSLNILLVGGTFSEDGGKPSGYIRKLINGIEEELFPNYNGNEIVRCYPWKESNGFAINLRGHGSIILANKVEYLQKFLIEDKLIARELLEK